MNLSKPMVIDLSVSEGAKSPNLKISKMTNLSSSPLSSPQQGLTFGITSILAPTTNRSTSSESMANASPVGNNSGTVSDSNFGTALEQNNQALSEWALALQSSSARAMSLDSFWPEMLAARHNGLFGGLSTNFATGNTTGVPSITCTQSNEPSPGALSSIPTTATPPTTSLQSSNYSFADSFLNARLPTITDPSAVFAFAQSISPVQNYPMVGSSMSSLTNNLLQCIPPIDPNFRSMNNSLFFQNTPRSFSFDCKYPFPGAFPQNPSLIDKDNEKDNGMDGPIDIETIETENSFDSKSSKRKRSWSRAVFSSLQRRGLERRFETDKYISKPDRKQLAMSLGLSDAQVKVWFQNRRMKWRHSREFQERLRKAQMMKATLQTSPFVGSFDLPTASTNILNNAQYLLFKSSASASKAIPNEIVSGNQ